MSRQRKKKENEARKNQKTVTLKEIRLSPRTDEHDIDVKTRKIQEFLADGDRVRVSVKFRGAEMRHPDIGRKLLDGIADVLKGSAVIERSPIMEGKMMSMIVSRAPGWEPPKKQAPPPAVSKKHQAAQATLSFCDTYGVDFYTEYYYDRNIAVSITASKLMLHNREKFS